MNIFDHEHVTRMILPQGSSPVVHLANGTKIYVTMFPMVVNRKKHAPENFEKVLLEKERHIISLLPRDYDILALMYENEYADDRGSGGSMYAYAGVVAIPKDKSEYVMYTDDDGITRGSPR